ncbi:phospholipase D family protein [Variovorax sp. J22R133]|uniref:phospholipase D family protein n=1 Tax=Variovorax brevis TaxID=3053503 RepID=UPI00257764A0|nr:phospholipase D family protein [Variovorax sp. J22R133]MDM0110818.1 phospholipase D family protein [Variovorax sp. J22R133]
MRAFVACALLVLLTGCASLPGDVQRIPSHALPDTADTPLGRAVRRETNQHPGKSGIHALAVANDAFAALVMLAGSAQRSLDLQYYIWHRDTTGQLLWQAVWQAAERGVRVRVLLDDANTRGLDSMLAALDAHPNIEIRLFNPFANRGFRAGDFALDFARVNRRMHNKSFTADNQVAVTGGRNIGDEYFGAHSDVGFQDLDVMAVGPVVNEVSTQFDLYWNSASAYPAAGLMPPATPEGAADLRAGWAAVHETPAAQAYVAATRQIPFVTQLAEGKVPFEWTTARVIYDAPGKALQASGGADLQMLAHLEEGLGKPEQALDLVSPYFVPGKNGTDSLVQLARRGVKVRVLTNSLAATDVGPVHAGYAKYRKQLLEAGITIYELKRGAALPARKDADRRSGVPGSGAGSGGSESSLHAKTFGADRKRLFVGSFNLDPRSARLNTEMGVVIDSPALATVLANQLDSRLPNEAYLVRLQSDGKLEWVEQGGDGETTFTTEPESGAVRRLWIDFLKVLPIEWML